MDTQTAVASIGSFLDQAMVKARSIGVILREPNTVPVTTLLATIAEIDEARAIAIGRGLSQQEAFALLVAEEISQTTTGARHREIAASFDSIVADAKRMVAQLDDGHLSMAERASNVVMNLTRGSIPARFEAIRAKNAQVTLDTQEQVRREKVVIDAYQAFRYAFKQCEVEAQDLLVIAQTRLEEKRAKLAEASDAVTTVGETDLAARARSEFARDVAFNEFQTEDRRYQVAKSLADNIRVGYNVTEVTMARLHQTHTAKERVLEESISFFATNTTVFAALQVGFNGIHGLNEATETLEAMRDGASRSLEALAEVGGKVQEKAIRTAYGPGIRADSVRHMMENLVNFQETMFREVDEMRTAATRNAEEIHTLVEEGKRRMADLIQKGAQAKAIAPPAAA